ncbi:MAG: class II SORL domain-containing protein [Actinomycetia bacterium]|nr:class II SORL domain-containing protein [Actinomycetes bacterium]
MTEALALTPPVFTDDSASADDFTKKHTPYLEVEELEGAFHVTVKLGYSVAHPNEPGHFFDRIELFCNGAPLAFFSGLPQAVDPQFSTVLNLAPGSELVAIAHCNLHGSFGAKITV